MSFDNVRISHGRVIPKNTKYDSEKNRGINVHGWLGKIIANTFGSGTVEVAIKNKTRYLNKASCYKLVRGISGIIDKSSEEYKAFVGRDSSQIIADVKMAFSKNHLAPIKPPETPPTVFTKAQENQFKSQYKSSNKFNFEDPLFNLIADISPDSYASVCGKWPNLDWFKQLEPETQNVFKKFLTNIQSFTIDRQNEVFRTEEAKRNAYALFQKGVIYLFNHIQDDPDLGQATVLQLNLAVGECPAAYLSFIRTAIHAIADQSVAKDETCEKGFHEIYALHRRKIAEEMASKFGRKETHTLNSILHLIGEERQIPGYQIVIEDKQMDIRNNEHQKILDYFDKQNSPEQLIPWVYKKIHGEIDGKWCLFTEIQDHLAAHFNIARIKLLDVIIDGGADGDATIKFKEAAVIACLEIFGIIIPNNPEKSATHQLQEEIDNLNR